MKVIAIFNFLLDLFFGETFISQARITRPHTADLFLEVEIFNPDLGIYGQKIRVPFPKKALENGVVLGRYVSVEYQFVDGLITRPRIVF